MEANMKRDPEIFDDPAHGRGEEEAYDQLAAESIEYDPTQFEVDEYTGDDDE